MDHLSPDMNLALIQGLDSKTSQAAKKVKESNGDLDMAKIEETAREFEAVFIAEMMKPMFDGIKTDGPFGGGKGEEIFRNMMVEEYGKLLSQTGGIGIASEVKEQMIRMQQEASGGDLLNTETSLSDEQFSHLETENGDENAKSSE